MNDTVIHRLFKNGSQCKRTFRSPHPRLRIPTRETTTNVALQMPTQVIYLLNGRRGIRTPGAVNPAVFKTAAIDHSAILPCTSLPQVPWKMEETRKNCSSRAFIHNRVYLYGKQLSLSTSE